MKRSVQEKANIQDKGDIVRREKSRKCDGANHKQKRTRSIGTQKETFARRAKRQSGSNIEEKHGNKSKEG